MHYSEIQLETPPLISKTWKVEHKSSNVNSLVNGFEQRRLGISFARIGQEKPYSSPTLKDAKGKSGLITATITGKGLDYTNPLHKKFINRLYSKILKRPPPYDIAILQELRNRDVDWVAGWNGIGQSNELHVLNVQAIHSIAYL